MRLPSGKASFQDIQQHLRDILCTNTHALSSLAQSANPALSIVDYTLYCILMFCVLSCDLFFVARCKILPKETAGALKSVVKFFKTAALCSDYWHMRMRKHTQGAPAHVWESGWRRLVAEAH